MRALNLIAIIGAVIGALVAIVGIVMAKSAPQEAAAAAIGIAWAVIPYCISRVAHEDERLSRERAADEDPPDAG